MRMRALSVMADDTAAAADIIESIYSYDAEIH